MNFKTWKSKLESRYKQLSFSILLLFLALSFNSFTGNYVDSVADVSVSDLILNNIPPIDIPYLYIYGFALTILVLFLYPLILKPDKLDYVISQFALLVFVRSSFIALTHLAVPADALLVNVRSLDQILAFKNDLFFSGHTAVPFLGALINRREPILAFFIVSNALLSAMVLVMHIHYSIDVFAAFFITFGCYKIGNRLFAK